MAQSPTPRGAGDGPVVERVRSLVAPIADDLDLDLYDVEQRGGTLRVTVDTRPDSSGGVDLDTIALATRLVSRELDHADPVPGRYTLEVTSPGLERPLRTPAHFKREVGKRVTIRLTDAPSDQRRVDGVLTAADDTGVTVRAAEHSSGASADSGAGDDDTGVAERTVPYDRIDRARTVFEWGPAPKPGGPKKQQKKKQQKKQQQKQHSATGRRVGTSKENHAS
ncbi:MAG: ribosome maturation factor RimP [Ilumatobacteraceae bacterium]